MSTKYEFRCMNCPGHEYALGDRSNHAGEQAVHLLALATVLGTLGAELRTPGRHDAVESLMGLDAMALCQLAEWFARHGGHDLRLFSEYGEEWGTCSEMIQCSGGCGHWRHCRLPPKHAGDHVPLA